MTGEPKAEVSSSKRYCSARCRLELSLLVVGFALLFIYTVARIHSAVMYRAALWSFERSTESSTIAKKESTFAVPAEVDFSLWSGERAAAYSKALATRITPLAVLSIRRLELDVPVFDGTDGRTLNRGAGRIVGSAEFGQAGNIAIAAHRDGFFRGLRDVRMGDQIELAMPRQTFVYTVDSISVVEPNDTSVLRTRLRPSLTLVTCYPFYLVGAASERYIVQASLTESEGDSSEFDPAISNMNYKENRQ
jgi:sortase A